MPSEVAEADAEGMEHYISDVTERVFTQFVGRKGGGEVGWGGSGGVVGLMGIKGYPSYSCC
nr:MULTISPECIES: hypothetical protein [Acidiphilium]